MLISQFKLILYSQCRYKKVDMDRFCDRNCFTHIMPTHYMASQKETKICISRYMDTLKYKMQVKKDGYA